MNSYDALEGASAEAVAATHQALSDEMGNGARATANALLAIANELAAIRELLRHGTLSVGQP